VAKKTLTARIPKELHKELRKKLLDDDISYQKWVEDKIKDYVEWEGEGDE